MEPRKASLSWDREHHLQALGEKVFDLLVVGGGATGCSVARDAALRGLDVCLVDRGDLAAGTSSRSTRFIHGGLRYLKTLEFGFVREGLQERATLMAVAPHLVHPVEFLFPALRPAGMARTTLRLGIGLYDLLAGRNRLPGTRSLSRSQTLLLEPCLRGEGLRGSVVYFDGAVDDARLVIETAVSAVEAGATVALHVEVERIVPSDTGPAVLVLRDRLTGTPLGARAAVVVNAAGAWAGSLLRKHSDWGKAPRAASALRPSRGSHLVFLRESLPVSRVVVMPSRSDGRLLFAVPAGDFTYLGTTEVDHTGPLDPVRAEASEVEYILKVAGEVFEAPGISRDRILCTWAGVRPLVERPHMETSRLSRDFRILQEAAGVVSVVGGKLTSCRRMAQATLDLATGILASSNGRSSDPCITGWKLFPGSEGAFGEEDLDSVQGLDGDVAKHLRAVYGVRAGLILRKIGQVPSLGRPYAPGCPVTPAEVIHSVEREGAVRLADLLFRRFHPLMMEARVRSAQGKAVAEGASRLMASWLGWTEERRLKELVNVDEEWERDFWVPRPE
ncbi:MAG: glycerol-3-phosphate dehydrogenase/oxidase [Acidobacteria bacterium]|nr:glycerol-3-phosphate dehydrogenase/oxidase [Acidobacteriota bacterium]